MDAVADSEIFLMFGDSGYIRGINNPDHDTRDLVELAKRLKKPFILFLDNSLPMSDQLFLRKLCPANNTQVVSFDPNPYAGMGLHRKMNAVIEKAINDGIIKDPFMDSE
jgi:hypothetical protein